MQGLISLVRLFVGSLFLASVFLNFANVIARYVFLKPIMPAEELLIYSMVWYIFLGAILVTTQDRHLRMDLIFTALKPKATRLLVFAGNLVFLSAAIIVAYGSFRLLISIYTMGERSLVAQIPMAIPYSAVTISFALMALVVAWRLGQALGQARSSEDADNGVGPDRLAADR